MRGPSSAPDIHDVLRSLARSEAQARCAVNLTPSENVLSPAARIPYALDVYNRYFFDDLPTHGIHAFFGALGAGEIETEVVLPLLRRLLGVEHVNVKPLSGLSCMVVALSALADPGDVVMTVPQDHGGHASTIAVSRRLGLTPRELPMAGVHDVDLEALRTQLQRWRPAAVYLDQSTELFPIDPRPIRALVDEVSPQTIVHYDGSHINGLVVTGSLPNPLDRGAHSLGGSTHKTLPGPHKGFLATDDRGLADRFDAAAAVLVSQHQPAAVAALAITLLELVQCDGERYGRTVLSNAHVFAERLSDLGVDVAAAERRHTGCHQVWLIPGSDDGLVAATGRLTEAGIRLNRFASLPGHSAPAFRTSVAEVTRWGADADDVAALAGIVADGVAGRRPTELHSAVRQWRSRFERPQFCFDTDLIDEAMLDVSTPSTGTP